MNCNHVWLITDKLPNIGKKWVIENGSKREIYYNIYRCGLCGEEKEMSQDEVKESLYYKDALNDIIEKATESDLFWTTKINEFLDLLTDISYDEKLSFMLRLINDNNKFNEFTKLLTKPYDAYNVYESYK